MRLVKTVLLVLAVVAVAVWPSMAQAADSKFELYGGVTRNTISVNLSGGGEGTTELSSSGVGWHVGGRYWFNPQFAAGLMVDSFGLKLSEKSPGMPKQEVDLSATGYLAVVDYQVAARDNWRALVQLGVGPYSGTLKENGQEFEKTKSAVGFLVGARINAELTENLSLEGMANYRTFSADLDKSLSGHKKADINGFGIGIGLVYSF